MSPALVRVVFASLLGATVAAPFLLPRPPAPRVSNASLAPYVSPNGDGRADVAAVELRLPDAGAVTVDVVGRDGGRVRRLAAGVPAAADEPVRLVWDGRGDGGAALPDGRYGIRVAQRRRPGSAVLPGSIALDTTPPRPVVVAAGRAGAPPPARGPAIVAPGRPVEVAVRGASASLPTDFELWRTDEEPARPVARFASAPGDPARGTWDGTLDGGEPAPRGTYLVVASVEDPAGNRGSAPAALPPEPGEVPGRPGVMVRDVAVQPPLEPVRAGRRVETFVDSRGRGYRWRLRRVGGRKVLGGRGRPDAPLRFRAPRGRSGVYLLEVRPRGGAATRVPVLVQSAERAAILAVLPAISWVGTDPIDDDGDGLPDTLAAGEDVRLPRPLAGREGDGLPAGFADQGAPLLAFLDRVKVPYDVTTDLALARSRRDPSPTDRQGVLLAGPARWIPPELGARLRSYAERGGRVASFGADALRRGVTLTGAGLFRPAQPAPADAFGAQLEPLRRLDAPVDLVTLEDDPDLGLLEGVSDVVAGFSVLEESAPAADGPLELRAAIGEDPGEDAPLDPETGAPRGPRPALTGARLGKGVVIRVGLPEWGARLRRDPALQQITRNVADILRRTTPKPRSPLP